MSGALARRLPEAPPEVLVEGEFPFTQADFARIAKMLREDSGIHLAPVKAALAYSRLAKRLRARGLKSFRDYCDLVEGPDAGDERRAMLAALTTNVTRFFREPHHFDHMREHVLPPLLEAARKGGRIRLWSAGCSTGQEPYSMALTLLDLCPDAAEFDVKILATDIDPVVVGQAREGVYGEESVAAIPLDFRRRWMQPVPGTRGAWKVGDAMRTITAFRELNLLGPWPMKGRFHAIFCRNVAIYFETETQERLWQRYAGALDAGGRLYIGHSERCVHPALEPDGLTTYKLMEQSR